MFPIVKESMNLKSRALTTVWKTRPIEALNEFFFFFVIPVTLYFGFIVSFFNDF